jgi:hypothetical protein
VARISNENDTFGPKRLILFKNENFFLFKKFGIFFLAKMVHSIDSSQTVVDFLSLILKYLWKKRYFL